jgi:hypothetical protein
MTTRRFLIIVLTLVLTVSVLTGMVNALDISAKADAKPAARANLSNVRDFTAADTINGLNYAVDGGMLFAGDEMGWTQLSTPESVIVGAVAVDTVAGDTIYIGAANEMAIYRSKDGGDNWLRVPLTDNAIGGVTDIAVDSAQRLIYVGTDTAGLFRLRDVDSSVTLGGHLLLDQPVLQVATDSTGKGLAFARTAWNLYRGENYGLTWVTVENLMSAPTAIAIADTNPATVYVGTIDRGVLQSNDGVTWSMANEGLNMVPGSRLKVDALAVDPAQPTTLYVATSYLYGSAELHSTPSTVAMRDADTLAWTPISTDAGDSVAVVELMPVSGQQGAVMALTTQSRTPIAYGNATIAQSPAVEEVATTTTPAAQTQLPSAISWAVAGLAAVALLFAVASDLRSRRPQPAARMAASTINLNNR